MSISTFKAKIIHCVLIIIGLLCILGANIFDANALKIDIDESIANLGVLLFLIGGIQWLYDVSVRRQLFEEISSLTVKNINVAASGIENVILNSKDLDYSDMIKQSAELTIGINYSPRILEDYIDEFKERSRNNRHSKVIALDLTSKAGELISSKEDESEHIEPNLRKLQRIVGDINNNGGGIIEILNHSVILKYSFVRTDTKIWIKPYRSSEGRCKIPAICFKKGTGLHEFFDSDIDMLIKQESA